MINEHKITYIANVYDEVPYEEGKGSTSNWTSAKRRRRTVGRRNARERKNSRQKLFCKCGGSVEFLFNNKRIPIPLSEKDTIESNNNYYLFRSIEKLPELEALKTGIYGYEKSGSEFEPVKCPSCGTVYEKTCQIELLPAHNSIGNNISRVRTFVFENEKTISLCCFGTKIMVNQKTKRIFSRDVKNFISFNKSGNFFMRGSQEGRRAFLRKFGLRFVPNNVLEVMWVLTGIQIERVSKGTASYEKAEIDMLSAIDEFYMRLLEFVNKDDAERLDAILGDIFGRNLKTIFDANEKTEMKDVIKAKHDFLFRYRLPSVISVVLYPPLATMFFTKGADFTLGLLNTWIVPSLQILKKERPTSPVKILETIVKLKLIEDSRNRKSMRKANEKAKILSKQTGSQVLPKRYYKYDDKIPEGIKKGDSRVEGIKITKNTFRNMTDPALSDAVLFSSINSESLPKNHKSLVEKYGLEACSAVFRQLSIAGRERIITEDIEHVIRISKKFIDKQAENDTYKYHEHTINTNRQSPPIDMYVDTIRIMKLMDRGLYELFVTKNFEEVKSLHDRLMKEYEAVKNEVLESSIKKSMEPYKRMGCEINGVSFTVIDCVSELNDESSYMRHCVRTYAQSMANGSFLVFRILDESDGSRATLGIHIHVENKKNVLMFNQMKSVGNTPASMRIKKAALKMMKDNSIKFDATHLSYDLKGADSKSLEELTTFYADDEQLGLAI